MVLGSVSMSYKGVAITFARWSTDIFFSCFLNLLKVYRRHLSDNGKDGSQLDATIKLLEHSITSIELFSTSRQAICSSSDGRLKQLDRFLTFLGDWQTEVTAEKSPKHFISDKLWFDIQSMIHGFKAIVNIKLSAFPSSSIKPWLVNQDVVENHFCQIRACNGQNQNPTYRLQEQTQNSIRYGQKTMSRKSNVGLPRS